MSVSSATLLKLIFDSKALSIWNHKTGPVFWYAAGVPGPFYLNTELMIGRALAENLLEKITAIVAENPTPEGRAAKLHTLIMDAYRNNADYRTVITALMEKANTEFPKGTYTAISGGERRDWLFSIPVANELGIKHIYMYKNKSMFSSQSLGDDEKALHISDLINNAASYFDLWLPGLQEIDIPCAGTLTVNTRGSAGTKRLEDAGYKVAALNRVDMDLFANIHQNGLIDRATLDELEIYFQSPKEWAKKYLMGHAELFASSTLDKKSAERMASFFTQDPWDLQAQNQPFFDAMRANIKA